MSNLLSLFPLQFSSSMLEDVWKCDMYFFRKHCQCLVGNLKNPDLIAGGHFASGCELVRKSYYNQNLSIDESIENGYNLILNAEDTGSVEKSNEQLAFALRKYFRRFPLNGNLTPCRLSDGTYAVEYYFLFDLGIPHPEIPDTNISFRGQLDMLVEKQVAGSIIKPKYVLDEKTAKKVSRVNGTKLADLNKEEAKFRARGQFVCLTEDHEVLTRYGWISIAKLPKETDIICWDKGKLFWDTPYSYIEQDFNGNLISYDGLHKIIGTPDHRQPIFHRKSKEYRTYTLADIPEAKDAYQFISGGQLQETNSTVDTEFLKFLVAMQADGCWATDSNTNAILFTFSKLRKVNRLKGMLDKLGVTDYTYYAREDRNYSTGIKHDFRITDKEFCFKIKCFLGKEKDFGSWLLDVSAEQLDTFLCELSYWDGYINKDGNIVYTSTNYNNIQWVQTVASLANKTGNIQLNGNHLKEDHYKKCWNIIITNRIHRAVSRHKKEEIPYTGKVYCVNVKSSYFIIRHKNTITVTGNCYNWAAHQLGVPTQGTIVRRVPVNQYNEDPFELIIPCNPWMIEQWSIATLAKIEELSEKYKYWKKNGGDPHKVFYPTYANSCTDFNSPCEFMDGCVLPEGEAILAGSNRQLYSDRANNKHIPLIEFKKQLGLE